MRARGPVRRRRASRRLRRALLAVGVLGGASFAGVVGDASASSSYCSPTGDYCHSAVKRDGVVRIMLHTFSFRGRVRVCVTDPDRERSCKRFRLRARRDGIFGFRVRWSRHFPNGGRGTYRVRFRYGGSQLGPADRFRR